jgi:hypothetical protein
MNASARTASRMESLGDRNPDESGAEGLAALLDRFLADPGRIGALHAILGPFCHQSRNVLNCLKMSLYLSRRDEARGPSRPWAEVERRYGEVEQLYDRLQTICRPLTLACVRMPLGLLLEDRRAAWTACFAAHERKLELIGPSDPDAGDYDPNSLGQALDALVTWRAGEGEPGDAACLRWWTQGGHFHLEWTESEAHQAGVERRGTGVARRSDPTDPLVLPLLGRVILAHGGEIELVRPSGRHVRLSWPQVARLPQ